MFHAITGYDTPAYYHFRGKSAPWRKLLQNPDMLFLIEDFGKEKLLSEQAIDSCVESSYDWSFMVVIKMNLWLIPEYGCIEIKRRRNLVACHLIRILADKIFFGNTTKRIFGGVSNHGLSH